MTLWRAQAILKHASGLPRDNATNTFWFFDAGNLVTPEVAEVVAENVRSFYVSPTNKFKPLMNWLSPSIVTAGHEIKVTPIVEATGVDSRGAGFPPLWTEVFDFLGRVLPAEGTPAEVAVCLSYKNMASGQVPPAQRRGRWYIGPLAKLVTEQAASVTRPTAALLGDLLAAGEELQANGQADGHELVVYSRPFEGRDETPRPGNPRGPLPALAARPGKAYPVTDFWVDNAFDTIRKRGERATSRVVS